MLCRASPIVSIVSTVVCKKACCNSRCCQTAETLDSGMCHGAFGSTAAGAVVSNSYISREGRGSCSPEGSRSGPLWEWFAYCCLVPLVRGWPTGLLPRLVSADYRAGGSQLTWCPVSTGPVCLCAVGTCGVPQGGLADFLKLTFMLLTPQVERPYGTRKGVVHDPTGY